MDFHVDISNKIDEKVWNDNLAQSEFANGYQIANLAMVYRDSFDSIPFFIYVKNPNNKIVGQLAVTINTKYYLRDSNVILKIIGTKLKLNPILRWEYGPIIHDKSNQDEILSKILSAVDVISLQNRVTMIRGTTSPLGAQPSNQIFEQFGYHERNWGTYVTDLNQNIDELYGKLSKETRYDIRKSEKMGLEFSIAKDFESFNEHNELSFRVRKNRGGSVKTQELFNKKFWENLYENGYLNVLQVKKDGKILAGIDALIFNRHILQYSVVNSPEGQRLQVGSFLTWNAIKWSIDMKYQTYDMGGINPEPENEKEKSINFYKSKWGGKELRYVRYTKTLSNFRFKLSSVLNNPKKLTKITRKHVKTKF